MEEEEFCGHCREQYPSSWLLWLYWVPFKEAVSHAFVRDSCWFVDTSGVPLCIFGLISVSFSFSGRDSRKRNYVFLYELIVSVTTLSSRWHLQGIVIQNNVHLQNLLFALSAPKLLTLHHLGQSLKLVEPLMKMRCGGGFPGEAASWIFSRIGFRHIKFSCSVHMRPCSYKVVPVKRCCWGSADEIWARGNFERCWKLEPCSEEEGVCKKRLVPLSQSFGYKNQSCSSAGFWWR